MKFLRAAVFAILAALLPMAVTVVKGNTDTVVLNAYSGIYPGLGGGEFTAYTSDQSFLSYYSSLAIVNNQGSWNGTSEGFETFCIEVGVDYTPGNWGGQTYYYTLGNISQPEPGNPSDGSGLALTTGAAYLYYEFATGNLSGYDYTYGASREADANLLQAAIWALQGSQTYGSYTPATQANNTYYAAAIAALGGLANADAAYTGTAVQILQLWEYSNDTGAAQNQLVVDGSWTPPGYETNVPDGGMTAGLLGMGLIGIFMIQSLRRKSS